MSSSGEELLAQKLGEVAVDLDGGFVACAGDDFARERGLARPISMRASPGFGRCAHDALDPVAVMKEVLTEAFAGLCLQAILVSRFFDKKCANRRGGDHARVVRLALSCDVERSAVVDRGPDVGKPERHVDALGEARA